MAKDLVAIAHELALEVENAGRRRSRLAAEDVALPVRHEREVPELDPIPLRFPVSSHIRPEVTTWNHMYPGIGGSVSPRAR